MVNDAITWRRKEENVSWAETNPPKLELGNEPFRFQGNTQNQENFSRVRPAPRQLLESWRPGPLLLAVDHPF